MQIVVPSLGITYKDLKLNSVDSEVSELKRV